MDPLELLPQEVWGMIFGKVEEPQDWLNLYRSSPTFEGVVGDQRTQVLFSKVLPDVNKHLKDDLSGLLSLRLASKGWKVAVDKMMESKEGDSVLEWDNNNLRMKYEFADSTRISSFLQKFESHPGNPFVGSFVLISFRNPETMANVETMVSRLFNKFGMYIKKMSFEGVHSNLDRVVRQLRTSVELTPNLEKLDISFLNIINGNDDGNREANPELGNQQLPIISKLNWFSFYSDQEDSRELRDLQGMIIRMFCNPDTLRTATVVGVPPELIRFTNLEKIELMIMATPTEEDAANLANYSCPLSRLTLWMFPFTHSMDLSCVVRYAHHFKDTLITLKVHCQWKDTNEDLRQLRLNLPHLKYLTIPWPYEASWPFSLLNNLSNLEELCVRQRVHLISSNINDLRWFIRDFEKGMKKFRIWKKLPKLKKVRFTGGLQNEEARVKIYYRKN